MPLPDDYLKYPKRRHGMDHDLYPWSNLFERPAVKWPGGKPVALWITIALEHFPLTPNDKPFRAPGHMVTPYPDLRTYTTKDYGNRVGIFRLFKVLDTLGLKASVPMNAAVAERMPLLARESLARGWEIVGHAVDMNSIISVDLPQTEEEALIAESLDRLEKAAGVRPTGWLSVARSESRATPALLAKAGLSYLCDWVNDDMPYAMSTEAGPIAAMPFTHEIADTNVLVDLRQTENIWAGQVWSAFELFRAEAQRHGGRILHLALTPYVIGQPFRIRALKTLLTRIVETGDIWNATGADILSEWQKQQ